MCSCIKSGEIVEEQIQDTEVTINNQVDLTITDKKEAINFYIPYYNDPPLNKTEEKIWEEFMYNEHGYNLNIEYYDIQKRNQLINEECNGIILTNSNSELNYFIERNNLQLLNALIKDYSSTEINWQKNLAGNIYSIPFSANTYRFFRLYDQELMKVNKLSIPASFEEAMECAKHLKSNGYYFTMYEDSFYGMTTGLTDLLLSFGCYPSFKNGTGIGYNPNTNQFEDAILSDSFKNAMNNIKYAKDNQYIAAYQTSPESEVDYTHIKILSYVTTPSVYGEFPDLMDFSFALQGNVDTNLIYSKTDRIEIGILNKTTEIEQILEMFVKKIDQNEKIREALWRAIQGYPFLSTTVTDEMAQNDETYTAASLKLEDLDSSIFYNPSERTSFDLPSGYNAYLANAADHFYYDYFTNELSYDEAITNYIIRLQTIDTETYINNLNKYIIEN